MFKDPYNESHWEHGEDWQNARRGKRRREPGYITQFCPFEGWAAGIAAAGVAVSAGSAIAGGIAKSNAAGDLQSAAAKRPKITPANFETTDDSLDQYINEYNNNAPFLQTVANNQNLQANNAYQQSLGNINPSLLSSIGTQGQVVNDLINGRIPADVQSQVQRSAAYQALTGQGSTDSGSAHALTARDLGTTSLGLEQQGSNMLVQSIANTQKINPYATQATDLLFTPQQLLARSDSNNAYNAAIQNGNANIQYANALNSAAANSYNPVTAGLTSGAGALGTALNGSAGQALGKGLSSYFGGGSAGGSSYGNYMTPGSDSYDQNTAYATNGGYYNAALDSNNYDADGNFIGNYDSSGFVGGG